MTKRKKYSSTLQATLFDLLVDSENNSTIHPGSLDIDAEFRCALSEDLRHAKGETGREISRYEVAAAMSAMLGREITAAQLNNWSAEAHEKHRFPAQYLPAFVHATGGQARAFNVLSRASGLFALPGPEALRAEIRRIDEEINLKQGEKKKRIVFLKEMEGK